MNNRFKFRVWLEYAKLYYGLDSFYYDMLKNKYTLHFENGHTKTIKEKDCVVEQCTGLKDKNGRLIYEGDIVKRLFFNDRRKNKMKNCVIKWCDGRAIFTLDADMRDDYRSYEAHCDNVFKECEVIGNIHENGDLLNED